VFDVAIVGAGPAGASLARLLAQAGARVVLLERHRLPRYKPCGGGLTARALRLLPAEAHDLVRLRSPGVQVVFGGYHLSLRSPVPLVGLVMRDAFDHRLTQLAAAAGAEVRDQAPVTGARLLPDGVEVTVRGEAVRARYLACADGSTGPFAGPLGAAVGLRGRPLRIGALEVEIADPGAGWGEEMRGDFDLVRRGYAWVFPKDGILSVGVASWADLGGRALREALAAYIRRLGLQGRTVLRTHGHPLPVGGRLPLGHLGTDRVLRLGDAAGLADPMFGEGIAPAMESAHLAVRPLLDGDLPAYARAVGRRLYRRFAVAAICARVFYPAPVPWFALVAAWPRFGDAVYTLAAGGRRRVSDATAL